MDFFRYTFYFLYSIDYIYSAYKYKYITIIVVVAPPCGQPFAIRFVVKTFIST